MSTEHPGDSLRRSTWKVAGIYVQSMTVYLSLRQPGEGGGGVRELDIPWRSTTSIVSESLADPLVGQSVWVSIEPQELLR